MMSAKGKCIAIATLLFMLAACSGPFLRTTQVKGVYHRIKAGETLGGIARAYGTDVLDLAVNNDISDPDSIETGRVIFIPNAGRMIEDTRPVGRQPPVREEIPAQAKVKIAPLQTAVAEASRTAPAPHPKERVAVSTTPRGETAATLPVPGKVTVPVKTRDEGDAVPRKPVAKPAGEDGSEPAFRPKITETEPVEKASSGDHFIWPVKGRVTSRFGSQPNGMFYNGIDITGGEGAPVLAAAKGRVTFSAFLKDYGETIIIQHEDLYATVYAHLGKRMVKASEQIRKGDQIALLGKTEKKGDAYLNFGIWYKNKARNPLSLLP
jgi:lipoprotein NlpD